MDPKPEAGETTFSVFWLFKCTAYDIDELRRACFGVGWRVCTNLQMGRMSYKNQQHEHDFDSEYLVVISSKHSHHKIFYRLFSFIVGLNVTVRQQSIHAATSFADSFSGW